jgi:hypothetical protein
MVSNSAKCGETSLPNLAGPIHVTGTSESSTIKITDSNSEVILDSISLHNTLPIRIQNSDVTFSLTGDSTVDVHGGINCESLSNLTFSSDSSGTLKILSESGGSGIGTPESGHCNRLLFDDGTYDIHGSSGLGTAGSGSSSSLQELLIRHGTFKVTTHTHASAIGTGEADGAFNFIHLLQIDNGTFSCDSVEDGSAIGGQITSIPLL